MIDPLGEARTAVNESTESQGRAPAETLAIRDALRALIRYCEDVEMQMERVEARLAGLEGAEQPPSGLMMGQDP